MAEKFKNTIITAPAGSGKTTKLVERYLSLLDSGKNMSEIVAITFTNKATGEMQERILSKLLENSFDFLSNNYFSKNYDFRISTIHSFLKNLLSIIDPFENPSSRVVSEAEDEKLFEHVIFRKINLDLKEFKFLELMPRANFIKLMKTMQKQLPISALWAEEVIRMFIRSDFSNFKELKSPFFFEVARFFLEAFEEYSELKAEKGIITYADMVFKSYKAVTSKDLLNIDLLAAFNEKISAVLLDEFQDTDYLQWKVISSLVEDWISGEGLRSVSDSSVFLIGDPMQSIYGFRGADPSIMQSILKYFSRVLKEEKDAVEHFEIETLDTNFRSLPKIVDFVNALFEKMFEDSTVGYTRFKAARKDTHGIGKVVIAGIDESITVLSKYVPSFEPEYVARKIKELVGNESIYRYDAENDKEFLSKIRYEDIAILVKTKNNIANFEEALNRYGIPFVSEDTGFTSLKPFEFLRNFFLLTDPTKNDAILPKLLSLCGEKECPYTSITELGKNAPQPLRYIYDAYLVFKNGLSNGLYQAFLDSIKTLEPLLNHRFGDAENSVFLEHSIKLFEEVFFTLEKEGIVSISSFSQALENRIAELTPKISHDLGAVTIMTIHKAKGLEFPVVFVATLYSRGKNESFDFFTYQHAYSSEQLVYHLYLSKPNKEKLLDGQYTEDLLKALENYHKAVKPMYKDFKMREECRLLYVAFTRARDRLYICMPDVSFVTSDAYKRLLQNVRSIDPSLYETEPLIFDIEALNNEEKVEKSSKMQTDGNDMFGILSGITKTRRKKPEKVYDFTNLLEQIGYKHSEKRLLKKTEPPSRKIDPDMKFKQEVIVGKIIHESLAEFGSGSLNEEECLVRLKNRLKRSNVDKALIKSAEKSFLKTAKWLKEVLEESEFAYFEQPFLMIVGEDEFKEGRIDFLYKDKEGNLNIVDFKFEEETEESINSYANQLANYVDAVKLIFGSDSVKGTLKFLKNED